jgi:hypothetical protein
MAAEQAQAAANKLSEKAEAIGVASQETSSTPGGSGGERKRGVLAVKKRAQKTHYGWNKDTNPPSTGMQSRSPMRAFFWNIRGFGRRGRRTMLKEYLWMHRIDIVCLQETTKQDFTDQELRSLEVGEIFFWYWLPLIEPC